MWTVVAAVAIPVGLAALVLPEHGTGFKPYIMLATVSLAIGAAALIGRTILAVAVRRFERLESGEGELARWTIDPATWRQFAAADKMRQAGLERRWGENILAVDEAIAGPLEIVVSREAVRVGEAFHELERDIMLGTRYLPGTPVMLEFYFRIIKPHGSPISLIVRFPVSAGAEQKARDVLAYFNKPIAYGPIARAIMAPGQAARRNPRRARNIALIVAAIGASIAAVAIWQAKPAVARAWEQTDANADLVALGVAVGAILAIPALIVALVLHLRLRRAT